MNDQNSKLKTEQMINTIIEHTKSCASVTQHPVISSKTIQAIKNVDRKKFLPIDLKNLAYDDHALGIGYGSTISQPFIVALMCDLLELTGTEKVLDIGSGSGYHAAILSHLAKQIYSIEIIPEVAQMARQNLLPYKNISLKTGNGYYGWQENAPFDAITIAAAIQEIPADLLSQLSPHNGKIILPLEKNNNQILTLITRNNEKLSYRPVLPVRFVPFTGIHIK